MIEANIHPLPTTTSSNEGISLERVLRPEILSPANLHNIHQRLSEGKLCLIQNAFEPDFAEAMHGCLDLYENWTPYESHSENSFFHYRHHNIYEEEKFPFELQKCKTIFDSKATKKFLSRITNVDCKGDLELTASYYMPGDYSLPHDDATGGRSLAFVWYLAKDWQPCWGGSFFWCQKPLYVNPAFNALVLFQVSHQSLHCVNPVAPYARGKRLAINGWWHQMKAPVVEKKQVSWTAGSELDSAGDDIYFV